MVWNGDIGVSIRLVLNRIYWKKKVKWNHSNILLSTREIEAEPTYIQDTTLMERVKLGQEKAIEWYARSTVPIINTRLAVTMNDS